MIKDPKLNQMRQNLDKIDLQIARHIQTRLEQVMEIGLHKAKHDIDIKNPDRETEVLSNIADECSGNIPMIKDSVLNIFREIISESAAMQRKLNRED